MLERDLLQELPQPSISYFGSIGQWFSLVNGDHIYPSNKLSKEILMTDKHGLPL